MRLTWKKRPSERFYVRESHDLRHKGLTVAIVARTTGGFYWYTFGIGVQKNTADTPLPLEEAKAQCKAFVLEVLQKKEKS